MKEYFDINKLKKAPFKLLEDDCIYMELKKDAVGEFINTSSKIGLNYYICKEELEEIILENGCSREEVIKDCLPDKGNVMAGEFGEVISTEIIQEDISVDDDTLLYNPFKLRWKEDRKKAALKTDIVLITLKNGTYNIYSAEVKAKSNGKIEDSIHDMFNGIRDDKASRLAETLYWIKEKELRYRFGTKNNLTLLRGLIQRLNEFKPIDKHFFGILVADKKLYSETAMDHIKKIYTAHKASVKKHLDTIKGLGIKVLDDEKSLDFSNADINKIMKLPEGNHKERDAKSKIIEWFNNANIILETNEDMQIKIIVIDELQQNYEWFFELIK